MSLDQRVHARCVAHASAIEQLATASIEIDGVAEKFDSLREHLRRMYSCRPAAFDSSLIDLIKECAAVRAKSVRLNSSISTDDKSFVVEHFYLAKAGMFQVVALDPYPRIVPDIYIPSATPHTSNNGCGKNISGLLKAGKRQSMHLQNRMCRPLFPPRMK